MASRGHRLDKTCATPGCSAPRDPRLTLRLLLMLPWLALSMRLAGFGTTYRRLERRTERRVSGSAREPATVSSRAPAAAAGMSVPDHVTALVIHVNRHVLPYQSRCLLESLALWHLLRRRGYGAELYLGARTLLGPFEAHAWVELDGRVLNDAANVRDIYEPFELASVGARPEST